MKMIRELKTDKSFDEIVSQVEEICKENKFGVLKVYEFHQLLEEKGFPIEKKVVAFEICNPQIAQQILLENPVVANFMPCKITVVEDENGVRISTYDINTLIEMITSDKEKRVQFLDTEKIKEITQNVQSIMEKILNKLGG
jgi:uncharacterized protein (DUF302 family)